MNNKIANLPTSNKPSVSTVYEYKGSLKANHRPNALFDILIFYFYLIMFPL